MVVLVVLKLISYIYNNITIRISVLKFLSTFLEGKAISIRSPSFRKYNVYQLILNYIRTTLLRV